MLIQVTPSWPPQIGGVGDYAQLLETIFSGLNIQSSAMVPGSADLKSSLFDVRGRADILRGNIEATGTNCILLHFSGFGYANRGLCFSLADALCRWRTASPDRRLMVIFHEVHSSGPLWSSAFWTKIFQIKIVERISKVADVIVVTSEGGAMQLRALGVEAEIWPVFSTVGESTEHASLAERPRLAVVFGLQNRRALTYAALDNHATLIHQLRLLGVDRIIDIGPGNVAPCSLFGLPIEELGSLERVTLRGWLLQARVGLVDYPMHVVTKSSIVAAYLAQGLLVINTNLSRIGPVDFKEGIHFVNPTTLLQPNFNAQAVAAAGHDWYLEHGLTATAAKIENALL